MTVQHQRVAVRVVEEGHVSDAGVEDLAAELDALGLELGTPRGHVVHPQRDVVRIRCERNADFDGSHTDRVTCPAAHSKPTGVSHSKGRPSVSR